MRVIKNYLLVLFLLLSVNVKADLTDFQQEKVADFARNMIIKGMSDEHIDENGMPLFVYRQGEHRVYGYLEQIHKVNFDYNGNIFINKEKWAFDCASFVSYVLKKTLNMELLDSNYLGGNPYMVSNFVSDKTHFISIGGKTTDSRTALSDTEIISKKNLLKKGDLIVVKGSHIGIYIGNNEIAEASSHLIGKYSSSWKRYRGSGEYNLGTGITNFDDFVEDRKQSGSGFLILRVKDNVVDKKFVPNTKIKWLDTLLEEDLSPQNNIKKNDKPKIATNVTPLQYTKEAVINIKATDEDGLAEYKINKTDNSSSTYIKISHVKEYSLNYSVTKNGTYVVSFKDILGNETNVLVNISNVDSELPEIIKSYYSDGYIIVEAEDKQSGLPATPYSFDNGITWQIDEKIDVQKNGEYTILVRDMVGNISKCNIVVDEIEEKKDESESNIDNNSIEKNDNTSQINSNEKYQIANENNLYNIILVVALVLLLLSVIYLFILKKKK